MGWNVSKFGIYDISKIKKKTVIKYTEGFFKFINFGWEFLINFVEKFKNFFLKYKKKLLTNKSLKTHLRFLKEKQIALKSF